MSERDLSRQVATRVVDALRARSRIVVVKGGAAALGRELAGVLAPDLNTLAPRLGKPGGEAAIDAVVGHLGDRVSETLVRSEHVEDVFADEPTLRRDVLQALRLGLEEATLAAAPPGDGTPAAALQPLQPLQPPQPPPLEEGPQRIHVRLDTLGYVASTAGKRAPEAVLREALARAAEAVEGTLLGVDVAAREADFALTTSDPDARLDLEEAVADELSALVDAKVVALPVVIRRVDLGQAVPSEERAAIRARTDAVAARTLLRSGCAASWELEDDRTLKVTVTPLSEQDALEVDHYVSLFARELASAPPEDREGTPGAQPRRPSQPAPPAFPGHDHGDDERDDDDDHLHGGDDHGDDDDRDGDDHGGDDDDHGDASDDDERDDDERDDDEHNDDERDDDERDDDERDDDGDDASDDDEVAPARKSTTAAPVKKAARSSAKKTAAGAASRKTAPAKKTAAGAASRKTAPAKKAASGTAARKKAAPAAPATPEKSATSSSKKAASKTSARKGASKSR